ncbi:hypothetical protein PYW08_004829 [Mythimna loreyi]|uniref:Uncharacterized protein n=1 Tax=Mythimna loreyi TaxID=667449 RepID=A0ACC2QID0_9NEOP|nr:hypothetical protein PYW08_004829 [Mythimna loreyi]
MITYISTEHPVVEWIDTKYFKNFTLLSKRISREDPKYYVEVYVHTLFKLDNNLKPSFYFYQFLTNRYRPSFVEMHFSFCEMMNSDTFFGETMRNAIPGRKCPFPPGEYDLKNMSIPYVPRGFPFAKGRIYCNVSFADGGVTKHIGRGSIDMEIKVAKLRKRTRKGNL